MIRRFAAIGVLAVPLLTGGCAVVDLAAHGIKEYDRRNAATVQPAAAPAAASQAQPAVVRRDEPEPPPVSAGVPPRESVTVETLPPQ